MRSLYKLILVLLITSGCAWLGADKTPQVLPPHFFQEGKIVDPDRLMKGGKLLIVPFRPGSNVAYDERFEKISLMIARGIIDVLDDYETSFKLLDASNADQAELILEGHVVELGDEAGIKKWVMLGDTKTIALRGKIIDLRTGQSVVVFTNKRESDKKDMDYRKLGHIIGQDIGRYILSGMN